jgi:hypothetical protein
MTEHYSDKIPEKSMSSSQRFQEKVQDPRSSKRLSEKAQDPRQLYSS